MTDLGHYYLVQILLRTAFLIYVRVLLCLQGVFLLFLAGVMIFGQGLGGARGPLIVPLAIAALFGLAGIVTAVRLGPGRPRAAMAAIAIELLWVVAAAAIVLETLREAVDAFEYGGHPDEALPWWLYAAGALFIVAIVGLMLRPVRAYAGLGRRRSREWETADRVR
jgi:hypothetical protein